VFSISCCRRNIFWYLWKSTCWQCW